MVREARDAQSRILGGYKEDIYNYVRLRMTPPRSGGCGASISKLTARTHHRVVGRV